MTGRVREPSGFWEWMGAVSDLVVHDGPKATALDWATHCATWSGNQCRPRREAGLKDLARRRRRDRSTIRRHLQLFVRLGLLVQVQAHAPGRKQLFTAVVPYEYTPLGATPAMFAAPLSQAAPAHPVQGTPAHPVEAEQGALAHRDRGHSRTVTGGTGAPSTVLQSSQTSSRARGSEKGGTGAPPPRQEEETHPEDEIEKVFEGLHRKAPTVWAAVDTSTRLRLTAQLRTLLELGWEPAELVHELTRSTFDGTRRPVGALVARVGGLVAGDEAVLYELRDQRVADQAYREQQRTQVSAEDEESARQRDVEIAWTDELAAAMAPDELAELLELVVAEYHPHLAGRNNAAMRQAVARGWLRDEYAERGANEPLERFLAEVRDKLDRCALDEPAVTL